MAHRLSITTHPTPFNGHKFEGQVRGIDDPVWRALGPLRVIPYRWRLHAKPRGWRPVMSAVSEVPENGRWSVRMPLGWQYAVLLVGSKFVFPQTLDGTLPKENVLDGLFASPVRVRIVSAPARRLYGFISAWWPTAYRADPVGDTRPPGWEDLHLQAWARRYGEPSQADDGPSEADDEGTDVAFATAKCDDPTGYWEFGAVAEPFRDADSYCVALVTYDFRPNGVPDTSEPGVRSVDCVARMDRPRATGAGRRDPRE